MNAFILYEANNVTCSILSDVKKRQLTTDGSTAETDLVTTHMMGSFHIM